MDTLAVERYLLEEMTNADRQAFEDHFFSCDACAEDLRIAAAMLQGAQAGFAGPATTGRVVPMVVKPPAARPLWYRSAALPWAAAAALAVVTAYQSVWVVPSLRRDTSTFAIVPITLRPANRGSEALVPLGRGTGPVSLAIDINDPPPSGELTYDLSASDGRHVASGRAAVPAAGTPLLLLIPSWTLVGSMHYILSVHDAGPSGRPLGEYRFAVSAP
jgi:hypothetical protein